MREGERERVRKKNRDKMKKYRSGPMFPSTASLYIKYKPEQKNEWMGYYIVWNVLFLGNHMIIIYSLSWYIMYIYDMILCIWLHNNKLFVPHIYLHDWIKPLQKIQILFFCVSTYFQLFSSSIFKYRVVVFLGVLYSNFWFKCCDQWTNFVTTLFHIKYEWRIIV